MSQLMRDQFVINFEGASLGLDPVVNDGYGPDDDLLPLPEPVIPPNAEDVDADPDDLLIPPVINWAEATKPCPQPCKECAKRHVCDRAAMHVATADDDMLRLPTMY